MIEMKNFRVLVQTKNDALLGYTGENLSRRLTIVVDDLGTWAYKLDIRNDAGVANIMDMTAGDGVIYVDIERAALQVSGKVQAQVRAINGDAVKCSNIFSLFIGDSVQAVNYFESLPPSEFEQLEANLTAIKSEAQASARKAKESENNAKAYAEGGTVQTTTYDDDGLPTTSYTPVTGAKGYQENASGYAEKSSAAMKRSAIYAEGGTAPSVQIGNVLYPAVDTIGAKGYMEQAQEAAGRAEAAALEVEGVVAEAADTVRAQVAADAERAALAAQEAQEVKGQVESVVSDAADAIRDEVKTDADAAQQAAEEAKKAAASAGIPTDGDEGDVLTKTANGTVWKPAGGGAVYTLVLSKDEADAQANTDAVTAAITEYKRVMLKPGDYPVKPGIVIESGKLDMNGAHFYTVDYKSETPLVYLRGEAPEICNGELEGSYDLADDEEGYEFFEKECLISPNGVNGACIHQMDLHNNWGYCISPGENVERVYAGTGTELSNRVSFITDAFDIPEGYKYVTAAGSIGYNYIISTIPVVYIFYDESGAEIAKRYGVPRKRIVIPSGAKTVTFTTRPPESGGFLAYYAYFTNYEETLMVSDCKFHNFHSLGMANMPGPATVTRCSFIESGKPRSDANPTSRATTGGIDIEDTQTPEFIMSDCYSRDCAKLLMFGGYKGIISGCVGDQIGIYRGWQCDLSNCNISSLYTIGNRCRISTNGVHADAVDIKEANRKDVRGDISTNGVPTNQSLDCFDRFVVRTSQDATPHGALSGLLHGRIESIADTGIRMAGLSAEKGSRVEIDSTLIPTANGNYYGAQKVNGDTYGLVSNAPYFPNGYTIHDSVFNIANQMSAYGWADATYSGGFKDCVFNLTGATYFRLFAKSPTDAIELTFTDCTVNNADNYLFNFAPAAGSKITFRNCTIADESKLFNGDVSSVTVTIVTGGEDGVDIDASLSVEGAAADAKAVGDALNRVGGNSWRQIADITFEEETASVEIATDMDGNALRLKECYVLVESKPTADSANGFTYVKTKVNGFTTSNNATNSGTTSTRYYYNYTKFIPGVGALCWHAVATGLYNNATNMQQMLRPYTNLYAASSMTSLKIEPNDGGKMLGGVGTTVKVWGLDS